MKMNVNEVTWYEDGSLIEWYCGVDPETHTTKHCSLRDAIELARQEKLLLVIQPELQDECIFVDYTE